jgi:hypothetical protein
MRRKENTKNDKTRRQDKTPTKHQDTRGGWMSHNYYLTPKKIGLELIKN